MLILPCLLLVSCPFRTLPAQVTKFLWICLDGVLTGLVVVNLRLQKGKDDLFVITSHSGREARSHPIGTRNRELKRSMKLGKCCSQNLNMCKAPKYVLVNNGIIMKCSRDICTQIYYISNIRSVLASLFYFILFYFCFWYETRYTPTNPDIYTKLTF